MPGDVHWRHASQAGGAHMLLAMSNNHLSTAAQRHRPDPITPAGASAGQRASAHADRVLFAAVRRRLMSTRPALAAGLLVPALALGVGCQGSQAKQATATVVGKVVELGKGTTAGVAEGLSEGREAGDSVDGARVVNTWEELTEDGDVVVHRVEHKEGRTTVTLAVANRGDVPLRVAELRVLALDEDGFALKPTSASLHAVTVPPKARERITVVFDAPAGKLKAVRVYDHDLDKLPAPVK